MAQNDVTHLPLCHGVDAPERARYGQLRNGAGDGDRTDGLEVLWGVVSPYRRDGIRHEENGCELPVEASLREHLPDPPQPERSLGVWRPGRWGQNMLEVALVVHQPGAPCLGE